MRLGSACGSVRFQPEQICAVTDLVLELQRLVRSISNSDVASHFTIKGTDLISYHCVPSTTEPHMPAKTSLMCHITSPCNNDAVKVGLVSIVKCINRQVKHGKLGAHCRLCHPAVYVGNF